MQQHDIEMKPKGVIGYPSLATFIASDKDRSTSIYRSYHRLSTRNILHLEAELAELEAKQDEYDRKELRQSLDEKAYARSWPRLRDSNRPEHRQRIELVEKIREKLKEYHEALILEEAVLRINRPHRRTIEALRNWFEGKHLPNGGSGPILDDYSAQRFDDESDLVTLSPPVEHDLFIRFVRRYLRVFFVDGEIDGPLAHVSERKIEKAVLLTAGIVNLYVVENINTRLGLIGVYTAAFALTIGLLTTARRAELFASTAAYAAVLVVFISGNLGSPS